MKRDILVIAAHPDDEVLGCGATMIKHALAGDRVHVLIMAEGLTSRDQVRSRAKRAEGLSRLAEAATKAHGILGVESTTLLELPDNRMDSIPLLEIVKPIELAMAKFTPSIVYTHHHGDLNVDHQCVHRAVVTACRPLPGCQLRSLLCFEVASSTEWQIGGLDSGFYPNWFEDASATLHLKIKALNAYEGEMRSWPHTRSVEAVTHLAKWRGASAGWDSAEAFMLGRHRNP